MLSALATISVTSPVNVVATQVATLVARLVPALDVCVTAIQPHRMAEVAFAGEHLAAALDERQYQPGYGPALTSATSGRTVVVNDTESSQVFADYCRMAARQGIRRVRAWPLQTASSPTCSGSVTVYGGEQGLNPDPDFFGPFLSAASVLVADAVAYRQAVVITQQMDQAMRSRAVIEQAKGMIMVSARCTDDEAFDQLKHISSRTNRKVRDVADSIVRGSGPDSSEPTAAGLRRPGGPEEPGTDVAWR